jgi:hypothetical protein
MTKPSAHAPRKQRCSTLITLAALCLSTVLSFAYFPEEEIPFVSVSKPFYITPQIRHLSLENPTSYGRLVDIFNKLEPKGAKGDVQIGYTLTFPLYYYFEKKGDAWVIHEQAIHNIIKAAEKLNRPFVVYIAADHFFGDTPFGEYLASIPSSLMQFQDGTVPKEKYFNTGLVPFSISNDVSLPHIKAKIDVLKVVARELVALHARNKHLLIGISMNGETHYMFENFFSGTGNFNNPRYTDFAPHAIQEFESYLQTRKLSKQYTASDIKKTDFSQYPWGTYPFFGWYCPTYADEKIAIYHNGTRLGYAEMQLNRMDVYEALPKMNNANCGFRYHVDFSTWKAGTHRIEAVLEYQHQRYALDNNQLLLQVDERNATPPLSTPLTLPSIASINRKGYVDGGREDPIHVHFEPLAQHWMDFRHATILNHQEMLADVFKQAGLPSSLLYNYQLPPWMNGDWNEALFGVGTDFYQKSTLRAGVTLYGGNTLNPHMLDYLPKNQPYGIPEFHPQMEGNATIAEAALRFHAAHGATFVSPYYMNVGDKPIDKSNHYYMLIEPWNTHKSSDALYDAIKRLARY